MCLSCISKRATALGVPARGPLNFAVFATSGGQVHLGLGPKEEGPGSGLNGSVPGTGSLQANPTRAHHGTAHSGTSEGISAQTDVRGLGARMGPDPPETGASGHLRVRVRHTLST
jgi:hypothetical protein